MDDTGLTEKYKVGSGFAIIFGSLKGKNYGNHR
jgi:hypothetical protein